MLNLLYVLATVLFTVYGQLVVKWQVGRAGAVPADITGKLLFLTKLLVNPWILTGIMAGFMALVCWMIAMTKFDLSYAYPFMSLAFILVLFFSSVFFGEPMTMSKVVGVCLVMAGIIVGVGAGMMQARTFETGGRGQAAIPFNRLFCSGKSCGSMKAAIDNWQL